MPDFLRDLAASLSVGSLIADPAEMAPYCIDWRGRETGRARAVVRPDSVEAVAGVVRACAQAGVPVFPQGGNTGLCYGAVPADDGIVISLGRMSRIRSVNRSDNSLICDAGVLLANVHQAARQVGRQFPLHLGSEGTAQIGGLISTNAGGTGVLRYGPMRDLVLGLEVVLADGRLWQGLSTLRKDNTAYDLKHLFIGAEGTLGIITGAALKLLPAVRARADAWVAVDTPMAALELLGLCQDVFDTRIQAFELLSRSEVDITVATVPGARTPLSSPSAWSVLIELGDTDAQAPLNERLEEILAGAMESGVVRDAVVAQSMSQAASFWHLRHSVSEANKRHGISHTHDVAVPVSAVPAFIAAADAMLSASFPTAQSVIVAHLGDGNVHYIAMFSREAWAGIENPAQSVEDLQTAVHDIAARLGGSFSAEHGVGRKLVGEMARLTSPIELELLRSIKSTFDPTNHLNAGVLF